MEKVIRFYSEYDCEKAKEALEESELVECIDCKKYFIEGEDGSFGFYCPTCTEAMEL